MLPRLLLLTSLDCAAAVLHSFFVQYRGAAATAVATHRCHTCTNLALLVTFHSPISSLRGRNLIFEALDVTGGMPELKQSSVDCVVDAGLLDKLVSTQVSFTLVSVNKSFS